MAGRNHLSGLLLLLWLFSHAGADEPTAFGWIFGGPGLDEGNFVLQTADGGFIATGASSAGEADPPALWLLKVDRGGQHQWSRLFALGEYHSGEGLLLAADGGYTLLGAVLSNAPDDFDVRLLHTDASGEQLWDRQFGGPGWDWGSYVSQSNDGGYVITGWTNSRDNGDGDLWLIKTDELGQREWSRSYGGQGHDEGFCVQSTTDGGYIMVGVTASYSISGEDLWLVKVSGDGTMEWMRTYGGSGLDEGRHVQQTRDGGYIVAGSTSSQGAGETDAWLLKITAEGEMAWNRVFGGAARDWGQSVQETADGGYAMAGATLSFGAGGSDAWLIRTDSAGIELWSHTYGGPDLDFGYAIQSTAEGGFIIAGKTHSFGAGDSDLWLIKTNGQGVVEQTVDPRGN